MPDLDLVKQEKQADRDAGGRFAKGSSGNPAGRPRGCLDHGTRAARSLLAGEAEALFRRAIDMALTGDPAALRLCVERILGPCRERSVEFVMPPIRSAADLAAAMAAAAEAAAQGTITPREAMHLGHLFESYISAVEANEFERRLRALEDAGAAAELSEDIRERRGVENT